MSSALHEFAEDVREDMNKEAGGKKQFDPTIIMVVISAIIQFFQNCPEKPQLKAVKNPSLANKRALTLATKKAMRNNAAAEKFCGPELRKSLLKKASKASQKQLDGVWSAARAEAGHSF
jgi:hypothetical protein